MKKRIFRSIFLAVLSVLVLVLAVSLGFLFQYYDAESRAGLREKTQYAAHGVAIGGIRYLESLDMEGSRVTWIDGDGTVLFDSACNADALENHGERQEVVEAQKNGEGESVRLSDTLAEKTCYYALLLKDGTVVRVSQTYRTFFSLLLTLMPLVLLVLAGAAALSSVLAARASRALMRPINQIDLEHPEAAFCYEELEPLLAKLSGQKAQLQQQMRELQRQQEEFATITENMSEGLIVVDSRMDIFSCNESARKLLGIRQAEGHLLAINGSPVFREIAQHGMAGEHYEGRLEEAGHICQVITNPVSVEGQLAGAVVLILDVTGREERERMRREFSANVSHELKTPLTSISGFAEIIREGLVKPEDLPRFAGKIYDEAQRMISLVGDILRLSQLDEGSTGTDKAPVDLLDAAEVAAARLGPRARELQVALSVEGERAQVFGIRQVIDEIITNLCENAILYNKPGGSVKITVEAEPDGAVLAVADTGIGIPENEQERVFERFYRVDKSHSKEIGGTGLGLSIVKHGASMHGASIHMESTPGEGTRICVKFRDS